MPIPVYTEDVGKGKTHILVFLSALDCPYFGVQGIRSKLELKK